MIQGFIDGGSHIPGLGQGNQRPIARVDRYLRLMALFFEGKDYFCIELVVQNLAYFCKTAFNFFSDDGSDFILPTGVFHIHERHSWDCASSTWARSEHP